MVHNPTPSAGLNIQKSFFHETWQELNALVSYVGEMRKNICKEQLAEDDDVY